MAEASRARTWLRRGLIAAPVALLALLALTFGITLASPSRQLEAATTPALSLDMDGAAARLGEAVRLETISPEDPADFDPEPFLAFHALLERSYPKTHAALERQVIADYSLRYRWEGERRELPPVVLLAHMDVVPIAEPEAWTRPPFSGERVDEAGEAAVWGRGTMDDKGNLLAIFEAAEVLVAQGFVPERTIYLCFGHDEEVGGTGAQAIAASLVEDGVTNAALVYDEGTGVLQGLFPGLPERGMAMVALAEKGNIVVELRVEGEGGHGSTPPDQTAIGVLAAAIAKVEANPFPARLEGPFLHTFEYAGPEMDWPLRLVATNLWLFRPVLQAVLLGKPRTAAFVRTTTAVTVIEGGVKANVLPPRATARINHRVMIGETPEGVVDYLEAVIDDPRVEVEHTAGHGPSGVSPHEGQAFDIVARALRAVHPDVVVAPTLNVAGSDARYYEEVSEVIYRFSAFRLEDHDVARYHGVDERLRVSDYETMIQFYGHLIQASWD